MTAIQYLKDLLERNKFDEAAKMPGVNERREKVEKKLRDEFGSKIQSIKYSGSIAKHTALKDSFDIDLAVHFKKDAFDTLKEMYDAVYDLLAKTYTVRKQRVSVGLVNQNVDVVPGRRINPDDTTDNDVNLYRTDTGGSLQTNIEEQKEYIRKSGARDIIKLTKIWRTKWDLQVKSFAVELLVIKALDGNDETALDARMKAVLEFIRDHMESVRLIDPGNSNNNVADTIPALEKKYLARTAAECVQYLDDADEEDEDSIEDAWRKVFREEKRGTDTNGRLKFPVYDVTKQRTRIHG
jgi:predicted nucleotidyltransferase